MGGVEVSDVPLVLDLCGGSGSWSKPYADSGDYAVVIVDTHHGVGEDVRTWEPVDYPVRGILAAPPCTHLAGSGARWWEEKGEEALAEALSVVDACLRLVWRYRPRWWALENPVGRLPRWLGEPVMRFDPCDYGDPWTKRTCLWGEFNEPEKTPVEPETPNPIHYMAPGPERAAKRSLTPPGFAQAFYEANP